MKAIHQIICSPLITEKGTLANETGNQVLFHVRRDANKVEIRKAVETFFKVKVEKVRTINYLGKTKRVGRSIGKRANWKKAYVTLAPGQNIDFFEST